MVSYEVMPELSAEEYEDLKADIAERGVMIPVEVDEDGNILDGYNRVRICGELGISDYPTVRREGLTEEEKLMHARKLNLARRHLSQDQRQVLIREQIKADPEKSDRQIAKGLGIDHKTVGRQREEMEASGDVGKFPTSIDTLGRKQPRKRGGKSGSAEEPGDAAGNGAGHIVPEGIAEELWNDVPETSAGRAGSGAPERKTKADEEPVGAASQNTEAGMSMADDLRMSLYNEADGLESVLHFLLDDYDGYAEKETMLFSEEGTEAGLDGLCRLEGVVKKYENLVSAREQQSEPGQSR